MGGIIVKNNLDKCLMLNPSLWRNVPLMKESIGGHDYRYCSGCSGWVSEYVLNKDDEYTCTSDEEMVKSEEFKNKLKTILLNNDK